MKGPAMTGTGGTIESAPSAAGTLKKDAQGESPAGDRLGGRQPFEEPRRRRSEDRQIVRFTGHQRAQHFLMMSSVLLLVFTGLPQKFFEWPISQLTIRFWGGLDNARSIHHFAGYLMLVAAIYHVVWLLGIVISRREPLPTKMIPSIKDARDFAQNTSYSLGRSPEKARVGRFSYLEKFDYWAVFWGVPVMGLTGLILMYPLAVTQLLPGVTVPVATIAHSDEAVLATGWLFVVHFYNAHFAAHIFPFNKSIFTGRVPEHLYKIEHPLEYEEIIAASDPEMRKSVVPASAENSEASGLAADGAGKNPDK